MAHHGGRAGRIPATAGYPPRHRAGHLVGDFDRLGNIALTLWFFCLSVIWAFSEISVKPLLGWPCLVMNLFLDVLYSVYSLSEVIPVEFLIWFVKIYDEVIFLKSASKMFCDSGFDDVEFSYRFVTLMTNREIELFCHCVCILNLGVFCGFGHSLEIHAKL